MKTIDYLIYVSFFSVIILCFVSLEIFVQSQETANVDILSVSTIPTCASIFSSSEDQVPLCGPNGGNTQVGEVVLNININEQQAGAASLVFNAFPYPGTTSTNPNPSYPCGSTPDSQNCTTFGSPITVVWSARPTVGAYQLKQIVSGVPLNYLKYFSPLVVDVDDEDLNWRLHPSAHAEDNSCVCRWYDIPYGENPSEIQKQCIQCPFSGSAAFIRGLNNPICQNSEDIAYHPGCGQYQVDAFCSCGGFPQECSQIIENCEDFTTSPNRNSCTQTLPSANGNNPPCLCFPFNPAPYKNADQINQYHSRLLKQGGMHQMNAMLGLDDECRNGGAYLRNDDTVLNFNNNAVAACRKMAYFIAAQNGSFPFTQIEQFVKINGPCAQYINSGGCGPPAEFFEVNVQTPDKGCPSNQECFLTNFYPAVSADFETCLSQEFPAQTPACYPFHNCDNFYNNGGNCGGCKSSSSPYSGCSINDQTPCTGQGVTARFGANAPLGNLWAPEDEIYTNVCLSCRADYTQSNYLPGLWGNQRKCKLWVDDWRECFLGSSLNAFSEDYINNPAGATLGFNYYTVPDPMNPKQSQTFVLQPVWCMDILGKCNAAGTGDTCWSSYNQPADFFQNPYYPTQGGITTQGYENLPVGPSPSQQQLDWKPLKRGLALTPYWMTPASTQPSDFGDGGHQWRCGQGCDPDYSNSYTSTLNNDFPTTNPKAIGTVKGMTGLGPLCTVYQVALQGLLVSGVDMTFEYVDSNGVQQNQTMTLTTDNIGTGSTYNTLNLNGTGAYGRIVNVNSPSGQTIPTLGGVLVVCGVDGSSTGEGALNGNLDVTNQAFSSFNPWNNLIWLLQQVEKIYPGITGYFQGGCPVPIPTFITALQCFSASTVCSAPPDLCQAISKTCQTLNNGQGDNCQNRGIIPYTITTLNTGTGNGPTQWSFTIPGTTTNPNDFCNADASGQSAGAAWYWLPPQFSAAFGTQFGQYGVNPWTDFSDEVTGQTICETPTTVDQGVPGVPGVTSNTDVDPPCSIIGNLARFHGQTSQYYNTIVNSPKGSLESANFASICLSDAQQTVLETNQTAFQSAQCSSTYSTFSAAASLPGIGLPPNWIPNNPQMWVHQNYFMTSEPGVTDISLEVELLISGAGLNVEIVSVENGEFTSSDQFCTLLQNSASGFANVTIENTGSQTALYQVKMTGCIDPTSSSQTNLANNLPIKDNIACAPHQTASTDVQITLSSIPGVKSLLCSFELRPEVNPNILLQTMKLNCVVQGFLQTTGPVIQGIDGKYIPPLNQTFNTQTCQTASNPGWWCWLFYGGWLAHSFLIFFLVLIAICSIVIIVNVTGASYYIQLWLDNSKKYNQTMEDYQTQLSVQQEKTVERAIVLAKAK